eukprot:TRINITY_DN6128_c0_g4_i1.p1 TRINITY_DN6128_c0_g4~~TRINITY_DN6128_c0_g4_i1.p1  ORF type:complete len:130 (-),score=29.82 TRINITY_DN6128_c0_g4_i1:156-524(-)
MIRRPPRSTHCISSAASDVYKRQAIPLHLFAANAVAYGLWNVMGWIVVMKSKGLTVSATIGLTVLVVAFLFQIGYCIIYFVADRSDNEETMLEGLEKGFGENIKTLATSEGCCHLITSHIGL